MKVKLTFTIIILLMVLPMFVFPESYAEKTDIAMFYTDKAAEGAQKLKEKIDEPKTGLKDHLVNKSSHLIDIGSAIGKAIINAPVNML